MLKFRAAAVAAVEFVDLNCFSVIMAEEASGDGRRLEIQRTLSHTDQDRRLGQDTYSISNEMGGATYGGIISWSLSATSVQITLDATAAGDLGVDDEILVEFSITPEQRQVLEEGLKRVLCDALQAIP